MSNKKVVIGVVAVVAVGALVAGGVALYMNHKEDNPNTNPPAPANARANAVNVSTWARAPAQATAGIAWAEPNPASRAWSQTTCTKDSLGDTMCPERWEWTGGQRDLCAWKGCNGEVDEQGRCTGCPPM